ncbi:MAG: NUDIX domain-containing protein [Planctomycetota bacterium]|nr:NUDIX domain-containing protein [Planctomycetota bacterium]
MDCKLIVSIMLFDGGQTLLVKYKAGPDNQTGWFLPNDLLKQYENPEKAAVRIISEQLSWAKLLPRFSHFESFKGQDASWHLVIHFTAQVEEGASITAGESVREARWFELDHLPDRDGVSHHGWALQVISKCLERLPRS